MQQIHLKNIQLYAYHGCLDEEALIGSDYRVDLSIKAHLETSMRSDELSHTVDYVQLNQIVKEEMAIRSKLLEHVGKRIVDRLLKELAMVVEVRIIVAKINPPIGGNVESVAVEIVKRRP